MIEQLLKTLEEKSKAHAITVHMLHEAEMEVRKAQDALGAVQRVVTEAYQELRTAATAISDFHYGETK